jgi:hypothetical protein
MERRIVQFHQDEEGHWVGELECGHTRHLRHEPPWQVRPWVLDPRARADRIGTPIDCRECREAGDKR